MKALTIRQPFTQLVVTGRKKLETRRWFTSYRGRLLIHAARAVCTDHRLTYKLDMDEFENVPLGAIIGSVEIVGCKNAREIEDDIYDHPRAKETEFRLKTAKDEFSLGNYGPGWWAWQLKNPVQFKEPIACIGNVDLWTPPASVLEKISRLSPTDIIEHNRRGLKQML